MQVFRLIRKRYASEPLSGRGAANFGARWNSVGVELIYTAANRSLAMAEVAVHLSVGTMPDGYLMATVDVPDDISRYQLDARNLPPGWSVFPYIAATQKIGDQFVANSQHCVLQVPSVVTSGDHNYLLNPNHPEFRRITIVSLDEFEFDKRFVK